jgi:hypothetical protein
MQPSRIDHVCYGNLADPAPRYNVTVAQWSMKQSPGSAGMRVHMVLLDTNEEAVKALVTCFVAEFLWRA